MLKNKIDKAIAKLILKTSSSKKEARLRVEEYIGESIKRQTFDAFVKQLEAKAEDKKREKERAELRLHKQRFNEELIVDLSLQEIVSKTYNRILVIPDLHMPYHHKAAFSFLKQLKERVEPDLVVCVGDEIDNHAMSFHDSEPDLDNAGRELNEARAAMKQLHKIFPNMLICHSNHGSLAYRRAKKYGMPRHLILSHKDALFGERTPDGSVYRPEGLGDNWHWADHFLIKTPTGLVKFKHGGSNGDILTDLNKERVSLVRGHYHEQLNVVHSASPNGTIFGMTVGCLIDNKSMAFNYNKVYNSTPVLGAAYIVDGVPVVLPFESIIE